jgi:hypothetical protein
MELLKKEPFPRITLCIGIGQAPAALLVQPASHVAVEVWKMVIVPMIGKHDVTVTVIALLLMVDVMKPEDELEEETTPGSETEATRAAV